MAAAAAGAPPATGHCCQQAAASHCPPLLPSQGLALVLQQHEVLQPGLEHREAVAQLRHQRDAGSLVVRVAGVPQLHTQPRHGVSPKRGAAALELVHQSVNLHSGAGVGVGG